MKYLSLNKTLKEIRNVFYIFVTILICYKIAYFNEPLFNIFKIIGMFIIFFFVPGYLILINFSNLGFLEKIIFSIPLSFGITGILIYYEGLVNIPKAIWIISVIVVILALIIYNIVRGNEDVKTNNE